MRGKPAQNKGTKNQGLGLCQSRLQKTTNEILAAVRNQKSYTKKLTYLFQTE
jgi:hypothetical protein